jgi:hypothetical protein
VEIYRVFPADSDVGRTSGPPTFSTSPSIPARAAAASPLPPASCSPVSRPINRCSTGSPWGRARAGP